ncbi:hypothetical protein BS642_19510 [Chromobacterium violaceum]|nr:hypothetical protein BS642_19510 [Chromobacterium violaceum]
MRQTIGFIQSLLKLAGLGWSVPDYSTLSRRQQTLQVKIPYQKSSGTLHLLVDSRHQDARRRRMENQEVWRGISPAMA